jgi:hypothetical protein
MNDHDEWKDGPKLSGEQLMRWKLVRAEQRAATSELRQTEAEFRAWIAAQAPAQEFNRRILELNQAASRAVKAEGAMRKMLEAELGINLSQAQVNLETGDTRIPADVEDEGQDEGEGKV